MKSRITVAMKVRHEKKLHPERFCPKCLWRVQTKEGYRPCPKHS